MEEIGGWSSGHNASIWGAHRRPNGSFTNNGPEFVRSTCSSHKNHAKEYLVHPWGHHPECQQHVFLRQNENSILKIEANFASLFFAKDLREMKGGTFLSLFCLHLRR